MRNVTIWALARPNDPSLRVLDEAGPGVRYVFGTAPADFAREAPSDAMLVCSMGRTVFEAGVGARPGHELDPQPRRRARFAADC